MASYSIQELAEKTGCGFSGEGSIQITGVSDLESATLNDVSFLANPRYKTQMMHSRAGCVVVSKQESDTGDKNLLLSDNPTETFQQLIALFCSNIAPRTGFSGIHETAVIHPKAVIDEDVTILPYAVIDADVRVGRGSFIASHVYIGPKSLIGTNCTIYAGAVIREGTVIGNSVIIQPGACIGSCGYGYMQDKSGRHIKLEQVGTVRIEDNVEVGANTTIDRARFKVTSIGEGTKIDNLVQIAHGVIIGKHSLIIAQTGIAGSARIGNHVILAGKVAVNGHISITDHVLVAACSGVSKSIESAGRYAGVPVMPLSEHNKMQVLLRNIESIVSDLKELKTEFKKNFKQNT